MPYFTYFGFWVRLVSWEEITLIQTFFYLEFFVSDIRLRQNKILKIRLKVSKLFESTMFICNYLFCNNCCENYKH